MYKIHSLFFKSSFILYYIKNLLSVYNFISYILLTLLREKKNHKFFKKAIIFLRKFKKSPLVFDKKKST